MIVATAPVKPSTPYLILRSPATLLPRRPIRLRYRRSSPAAAASASAMAPACVPIVGDRVFRFDASDAHRAAAAPSLSFADPQARESPLPVEFAAATAVPQIVPEFIVDADGAQKVVIKFPPGTSFYGTGEAPGPLERTGKRMFTWNTDAWGFGPDTTSLYQSHPWVLVLLPDGSALGVLADTTRRCEIDLRKECTIKVSAGAPYPIITFGPFATPADVLKSLSRATGTVSMPPKWALGYHQCRWSYFTSDKVVEIARTFRDRGIPCDVIWMDIDYMDGFRCFTFDKERFSNPKNMVEKLHSIGFKAIWMLDPGVKAEPGYFVYDSGNESDVWVKKADGSSYIGEVWPGPCVFPDFTQKKVRLWWADLVKDFTSNGADGIWNDMNEPAIFKSVTKTMPEDNIHKGDTDLGGQQNHGFYHNVYGMLQARSTYEGMSLACRTRRPFVLTRAGFVGSQRYAATWTGDNLSNWEHLHMSIPMVLQLSLSGQPLSGPDIGGFAGNATAKLFGRWMGIGAMFPFSRGHTETGSVDHEPWSFGEECEVVCRLALLRRYRLLPHLYTLFYKAHVDGTPIASPVFFADPRDPLLRTVEDCFLLGALLVCSSTLPEKGAHELSHKLPKGIWFPFDFEDPHPDLPVLYLQGGGIIPVGLPIKHVDEGKLEDELTLFVALDEKGKAAGVLFEDDGDGYDYTQGGYLLTYYVAELSSSRVTVKVAKTEGLWKRPRRAICVKLLLGGGAMVTSNGIDGEEIHINMPSDSEVSEMVAAAESQRLKNLEMTQPIPYTEISSEQKDVGISKSPLDLRCGDWVLKVVPWIGGRIISMQHLPSGTQWLHSRIEINGYEEYSNTEYRSAGCTEEYQIIQSDLEQSSERQSIIMEGNIGGGLILRRKISSLKDDPKVLEINSGIIARNVGAGSGGFSRLVCLRVHPTFTLMHPADVKVQFTSIDGARLEISPDIEEQVFEGGRRPAGEWMLVDNCAKMCLVNSFETGEVDKCVVHWGHGNVNLELWSSERPVSAETPLGISHRYEVRQLA